MLSQKSFGNLSTSFSEQPASENLHLRAVTAAYALIVPSSILFSPVSFKTSKTSVRAEYAHAVKETALGSKL